MYQLIVITGTPGVGKTTLAKELAKQLGWNRLDLHDHYSELASTFNKDKDCYDLDLKKVVALVKRELKQDNLILDSHIAHLLPKSLVAVCIVLTCLNLKKLESRLKKRKYSKKKIRENLDAEIFQICLLEAQEKQKKVLVFDTSKRKNKRQRLRQIEQAL